MDTCDEREKQVKGDISRPDSLPLFQRGYSYQAPAGFNLIGQDISCEWVPKNVYMTDYFLRKSTFNNWPKQMSQTGQEMAAAGFYYPGFGDRVICFMCGNNLHNWETTDVAKVEHKRHFPSCKFSKMIGY